MFPSVLSEKKMYKYTISNQVRVSRLTKQPTDYSITQIKIINYRKNQRSDKK